MALSAGVAGGMIICGGISTTQTWRVDYYLAAALVGAILLLLFFTLPETAWNRVHEEHHAPLTETAQGISYLKKEKAEVETAEGIDYNAKSVPRTKDSYGRRLHVFSGSYTKENLFLMMARPMLLILLPPVLWASLIMAVTIGFLVAISSNIAPAFAQAYGFGPLQSALCFVAALIGSALGIYFGGKFTDIIADYFTRRNNGIREPEFRLVSIGITLMTAPLALLLYGAGIQYQFHWMMPTMGLLLCKSTSNTTKPYQS
jgi:MFS family permease